MFSFFDIHISDFHLYAHKQPKKTHGVIGDKKGSGKNRLVFG
jgi:hypothetical protein